MIAWVYAHAREVAEFDQVLVATDDERIRDACQTLGMDFIMTDPAHPTGTDRLGEVARRTKADLYVNIQGDEPMLEAATIRAALAPYLSSEGPRPPVTNLMTRIRRPEDVEAPTVIKVVVNARSEALFMSRAPIPFAKKGGDPARYKQVCVYAFTPEALSRFCELGSGRVEQVEEIELLRFIEAGMPVRMIEVERDTTAVDTPADLETVRRMMLGKA